jgi:hypothetical protein
MLKRWLIKLFLLPLLGFTGLALVPVGVWADTTCLSNDQCLCPSPCDQLTMVYVSSSAINVQEIYVGTSDTPSLVPTLSFEPGDIHSDPPRATHGDFISVQPDGTVADEASSPVNVNPYVKVTGNQTDRVTITFTVQPDTSLGGQFSTGLFPAGYSTHVGIRGTGRAVLADQHWSKSGTPTSGPDGHMPGVNFTGQSPGDKWMIVRTTMYSALSGGAVIGEQWTEEQATGFSLTGSSVPLYVSSNYFLSNTEIPLEDLNHSLDSNFGLDSPIVQLNAAPEPSSLVLVSAGVIGMIGYFRCRGAGRAKRA